MEKQAVVSLEVSKIMSKKQKREQAPQTQNTQQEQYTELYNDLPQEVQDILMENHPLKGNEKEQQTQTQKKRQYTRRPQREDVEEVKEARMQQVGSELNAMQKAPQQESAPTKYVSRRAQSAEKRKKEAEQRMLEEAEYEEIQFVSMMPKRKKANPPEEMEEQTVSENTFVRRWRKQQEESPFPDWQDDTSHTRYNHLDFAEKAKQEHLDSLYDEDDYDDENFHIGKSKVPLIIAGVGLVLLVFLIFKTVTLSSRLHEAEIQMKEVDSLKQRYEQVQLEKMQLEEELQAIKNPDGQKTQTTEKKEDNNKPKENKTDADKPKDKTDTNKTDTNKTKTPTDGAKTESYTVLEGETPWDIAQKVYGSGADYQKILDANGLKDGDTIRPGDVLKIPKN